MGTQAGNPDVTWSVWRAPSASPASRSMMVTPRVRADQYDALLLPGGALSPDKLRSLESARSFVRSFDRAGKPIAVICHGPWTLISAGLVRGRTITSYHTIQDDLRNAGANWVDQEVVVDRNWVSSRSPRDLPAFNREMVNLFTNYFRQRKAA